MTTEVEKRKFLETQRHYIKRTNECYRNQIADCERLCADYETIGSQVQKLRDILMECKGNIEGTYDRIVIGIQSSNIKTDFDNINGYAYTLRQYIVALDVIISDIVKEIKKTNDDIAHYRSCIVPI